MATTNTRQTNLFAVEDWKKLYTTFSNADFQSYDFETLRKVMIDYLRTYYSEDYNDFIESSEFIALIDLIAFTAQSTAFRADLNARENFLETAERRDSVLKLVKQLSYVPNRNKAASGLLKLQTISTTENVYDSSGNNLAKLNVNWNDTANPDWSSQWLAVLNGTFANVQRFGKPYATKTINGIRTDQYNVALPPTVLPVFSFAAPVLETISPFEVVSANITDGDAVSEQDPGNRNAFGMIYQSDGKGNASSNTGFFLFFKQGSLQSIDFTITDKIPNRVFSISSDNVNNDDVWLYDFANATIGTRWTKVLATSGNNAIYNSTARGIRKLFSVNSRVNDNIDLVFGDGVFADMPLGDYRAYYRISNGNTYRLAPSDLTGITITMPYVSKMGRTETLTISASLQYTVSNSSRRDLISEIKAKAPQNFYAQGRMVNGEDYNILPYTQYPDIVKVKSVNRYSAGISRFLDVIDPTGRYSSTDMFASDGSLYKNLPLRSFTFNFNSRNDVVSVIRNKIVPIIANINSKHFYYANYPLVGLTNLGVIWARSTNDTTTSTGFFTRSVTDATTGAASLVKQQIGNFATNELRYLLINSLIKFTAPSGYFFDSNNVLQAGTPSLPTERLNIWATIQSFIGNGSNAVYLAGREIGAITLSDNIPSGALVTGVYAPYSSDISNTLSTYITNAIIAKLEFGLRFDYTQTPTAYDPWTYITGAKLNTTVTDANGNPTTAPFNLSTAGSNSDSSWMIWFKPDALGINYTVTYRGLEFIFNSLNSVRFLNSNPARVYDSRTNTVVKDNLKVLGTNKGPTGAALGRDLTIDISANATEIDGYVDSSKVLVTYQENSLTGLPVDPTVFDQIIGTSTTQYVFYHRFVDYDNLLRYSVVSSGTINSGYATFSAINLVRNNYPVGQVFYATAESKFYSIASVNGVNTVQITTDYLAFLGRQDLYFQYRHNANDQRRIDPASSNLIDTYILTRSYDEAFRNYIADMTGTVAKPDTVNSNTLINTYSNLLNLKMLTDEMILTAGVYRPLFGSKAATSMQGKFQAVKNHSSSLSDNELKSRIVDAVTAYFALENWNFGETFYFSELSAYLHSQLEGDLASIILLPTSTDAIFGSLYEIRSQPNEIFISAATVDNVEVVAGVLVGINYAGVATASVTQAGSSITGTYS